MAEVTGIDRDRRVVTTSSGAAFAYDFLILATGSTPSYFGHDEWALFAPGLKRIEDAVRIRRRILEAFELAELADDPAEQRRLLTFVIIGGGPTGVELAGAIAEIARYALARDFRRINPRSSQIVLVEAGPRLLPQFPESLSAYAERELNRMGVKTLTHTAVRNCSASSVQLGENTVSAETLIWAAGVKAAGPAHHLAVEVDRAGRIKVDQNLMLPGDGAVYVIGDTALVLQGNTAVPGLAPAAKQMGRYAADAIVARLSGNEVAPFKYRHYGDLATIGRKSAVVAISGLKLRGFLAWAFWGAVHIFYLLGVRNRLVVLLDWLWAYVTFERGARLIEKAEN
jgi:NADH dehydrogenase